MVPLYSTIKGIVGVILVRTEEDYNRAMSLINSLLDVIKGDEEHPLADVLNYLADLVIPYEEEHYPIPNASPRDLLEFLMEQQGLKQEDLADCAPQSRISAILSGKRTISKEIAKRLAKRFKVSVNLFI
jgi:HTH-type transcriptional regulator / antitoxin HigA